MKAWSPAAWLALALAAAPANAQTMPPQEYMDRARALLAERWTPSLPPPLPPPVLPSCTRDCSARPLTVTGTKQKKHKNHDFCPPFRSFLAQQRNKLTDIWDIHVDTLIELEYVK